MEEIFDRLALKLQEKNSELTYEKARTWVELLWEDFETTQAKAGREYQGKQAAERIVTTWIDGFGHRLHEFLAMNPKYSGMLGEDDIKH
ncbi:YfhJ family protein [Metabacillus sp. GX 13764]|uniref:YfhJ family protein n=1 Tax=Metabacillus kandeliae TaxID=2900151 RepID=UPI001E50F215|nr:YfhJ family protein [Metabacillus kandeliae]MCD7036380.1 YfhJ family protein [Metabacillus kandeliae]